MDRPNVLLITVDQMRGDCLGVLGHPVVETPHLDTMAHRGSCLPMPIRLYQPVSLPGLLL